MVTAPSPSAPVDGRAWLPWPRPRWGRDAVGAAGLAAVLVVGDLSSASFAGQAVVVAACVALAWRRTAPLPVLGVVLVAACVGLALDGTASDGVLVYAVALYTAVERSGAPVRAVVTGVLGTAVLGGATMLLDPDADVLADVVAVVAVLMTAVGLGLTVGGFRHAVAAERQRAVTDRDAAVRRRIAEERVRIARELHDVVGHQVAVVTVQAGLAEHLVRRDPDAAAEALGRVREAGARVLEELPVVLRVLRQDDDAPVPDSTPPGAPTAPAPGLDRIGELVDSARTGGLDVVVERDADLPDLPAAADLTAYRVVQEALTNAARHGAGHAVLRLHDDGGTLVVEVENAVGPARTAAPGAHLGLVGMQERVEAAAGRLDVGRHDDTFRVRAVLPGRTAAVPPPQEAR